MKHRRHGASQRRVRPGRWGALASVIFTGVAAWVSPLHAAAASPVVYEWGRPVASGGPGVVPTAVQSFPSDVAIDAGNYSDVTVMSDGSVWGWGVDGSNTTSMTANRLPGLRNVLQRPEDGNRNFVALEQPGSNASCPTSSSVYTWASNHGPQNVPQLDCKNVVQLASAAGHITALTATGQVYVWGGGRAALGLGAGVNSEKVPTLAPTITALTSGTSEGVHITAGMTTGGILVNGQAYSWGDNQLGQCGCGSTAAIVYSPTAVSQGGTVFTWIDQGGNTSGSGHELALDTNGRLWSWGDNASGQLGIGTTTNSNLPVQVVGLPAGLVDARAGGQHSLALDSSGNVWAWGLNAYGQVGDGTLVNRLTPVEVLSGVTQISAGSFHSIAQ